MQGRNRSLVSLTLLTAVGVMHPALWLPYVESAGAAQRSEPITPVPTNTAVDGRRAAIGERLFHDVRLSGKQTHSCATCHPLSAGGMDAVPIASRPADGAPTRNTPTIFNVSLNASLNWDGVVDSLESHTARLVPGFMGLKWPDLLGRLRADAIYRTVFDAAYSEGITQDTAIDALVSFEQTLLTPNAAFDRYLLGAEDALGPRAREGYARFKEYGCASCHQGVNAGGNLYQRFGLFETVESTAGDDDVGRLRVTNAPRDRWVFRVPSLRNVAVTAPYFHDGRALTLEEAVETMGRAQLGRVLSPDDTTLIVAFLQTLTGQYQGARLGAHRDTAAYRFDVAK
jgi:cytochrome c peroxidase